MAVDAGVDPLVEATYDDRLAQVSLELSNHGAEPTRLRARRARAACESIGREVQSLAAEVAAIVGSPVDGGGGATQRRSVSVGVADHDAAAAAADLLEARGFVRWQQWSGGAHRSFARHASELTLARTSEVADVVRLRWPVADRFERMPSALRRALRPTEGDWAMATLPEPLSGLYSAVRLGRLVTERVGLRPRHESSLGPFLATPAGLITEIGRFASIRPDDFVADLGCGDGRIAVELAQTIGCRAIGVESDRRLVDEANERVRRAGVTDLVSIEHGDARAADLSAVTVVVLFLPAEVVVDLVPDLLARLPTGSRIVAHEQHRPAPGMEPAPDATELVVGAGSVSVAHRWTVR